MKTYFHYFLVVLFVFGAVGVPLAGYVSSNTRKAEREVVKQKMIAHLRKENPEKTVFFPQPIDVGLIRAQYAQDLYKTWNKGVDEDHRSEIRSESHYAWKEGEYHSITIGENQICLFDGYPFIKKVGPWWIFGAYQEGVIFQTPRLEVMEKKIDTSEVAKSTSPNWE